VVVDRIVVREGLETRLADSLPHRADLADGIAMAWKPRPTGRRKATRAHRLLREFRLPGLRLHHPRDRAAPVLVQRAVRRLPGLRRAGVELFFDERLVVPDRASRSMTAPSRPGARASRPISCRPRSDRKHYGFQTPRQVEAICPRGRSRSSCAARARRKIQFRYDDGLAASTRCRAFEGVIPNMERRYRETDSLGARGFERYQNNRPAAPAAATACKPEALAVKIAAAHLQVAGEMSIREALRLVRSGARPDLSRPKNEIARAS
jgi:excinuclease ABC subunit A